MITRGSKVAAEKSVRDLEGGADMGSPDRREPIAPPDTQESPVFMYLSNLSPIKPAKSVHHAQTYNEMTFPPEPRIFASPRSTRRSSTSSLKRVLAAERSSALAQAEGRESLGWHRTSTHSKSSLTPTGVGPSPRHNPSRHAHAHAHGHQGAPSCSRTQSEERPVPQPNNIKIESLGNKVYLAENLVGQGMFAMNATQLNPDTPSCEMDRTAASAASFQTQFTDYQQLEQVGSATARPSESARCVELKQENLCRARGEQVDAVEHGHSSSSLMPQMVDSMLAGNLSQESKCRDQEHHHRSLSMASSSHNEDHGVSFNVKCEGEAELDQDTTAMAYFLAGDQDLGQDNREDDWSEDSGEVVVSGLPLRRTSGYAENQSDMLVEENVKQENNMMDAITSQSGLGSTSHDRQDAATALTVENTSQQPLLLTHNRADTTGQRGFRRRCLDFDASIARRKSLGSMGGRKSLGSRLKDSGGNSSPADANNPSSVLTDRVAATSDATKSGLQAPANELPNANESFRAESNSGGAPARGAGGSACEGNVGAMSRMQLSSCSFKKSMDALSARTAETLGRKSQDSGNTLGGAHMFNASENRGCSPSVRPTGIGLHLNSLTSSMSFKRDFQATGIGSGSKGVLATVLGIQPLASATPKEDPAAGEGYGKPGMGSGGGFTAMLPQNFSPGVASLMERRSQMEKSAADASLSSKRVKIPTPDFRSLNMDNLAPLEEPMPAMAAGNGLLKHGSPVGQKRPLPHQQEMLRQPEGEAADDLLESPQSSKKRRRKSTPASGDKSGEGCKRCNCKKSKCLKLYCECFAAGVYCVGSCACRDCFNKPEFEETVLNTRQQIESRNPLAFAPKIVQAAESSPTPGDEALDTPASARHKRGCNCKKSLCLKKYCECYQAGVGCSEGCRCEGCKNMYGRKEGPEEGEEKEDEQAREEPQTGDPIELLNRMSGKSDRLRESAKSNLSPITPTFEYDGLGRSTIRLRSTGRKRAASDEHCASPLPQPGARPAKSPTRFSHTLDAFHLVSYPQGEADFSMSGGGDSPMTTPTFARISHLSPRWEGLGDICTLTPLPLAPLRPTAGSSAGTLERPGASPSFSTQLTEPAYHGASSASGHHHTSTRVWSPHRGSSPRFRQPAPRSPLRFDTPRQSSSGDANHATPLTPSLQAPSSPLTGKNLQSELESVKAGGGGGADDDDTPDFLKYADDIGSPSRTTMTKSGSPKQKRVTPPRYGVNREQQGSSRSASGCGGGGSGTPLATSPGLRNSRKFILQALPSLPPVTPPFSNG